MKILARAEALRIERACNIIEALNNNVSLFESFDVEAVRRSKFQLALTQVVTKIRRISPRYTRFTDELGLKCHEGTTFVNIVRNVFHPNVDYEDINANAEDERELASELQFLVATDLEPGTVNKFTSDDSIGGDSS